MLRIRSVALATAHRRAVCGAVAALLALAAGSAGRVLYNGIRLNAVWPPARQLTREPMAVPYLKTPPAVIPIDLGRQLFVDDFLIQRTSLRRTFHPVEYHAANPVLRARHGALRLAQHAVSSPVTLTGSTRQRIL